MTNRSEEAMTDIRKLAKVGGAIKRILWNLRYAGILMFRYGWGRRQAWEAATFSEDSYTEGLSPQDAIYEDIRD